MGQSSLLNSPFATGNGGGHFEAHIQACFVTLMLADGYAPCFPGCPITKIKLQGKIDGFDTDDMIIFTNNPNTRKDNKILCQIKYSFTFTKSNTVLKEVLQSAWNDYNNQNIFFQDNDIISLITGPLNTIDTKTIRWILDQAHYTLTADEFFRNINKDNFSPPNIAEKMDVITCHLKQANNNVDVPADKLYHFLKHFYLFIYDLGGNIGFSSSLLQSLISRYYPQDPQFVWSRIVDIVQTWNQNAGTLSKVNIPQELKDIFILTQGVEYSNQIKYSSTLALVNLIGAWDENNKHDIEILTGLTGKDYNSLIQELREILNSSGSPVSVKNGLWKINDRKNIFKLFGNYILDNDFEKLKNIIVSVLTKHDPVFDGNVDALFCLSFLGNSFPHSILLREGLANGLAMISNNKEACTHFSASRIERSIHLIVSEIFKKPDWILWRSLDHVLPLLAEASPETFMDIVKNCLKASPCPFDQLFAQEGNGIAGWNYITGLLWALETLAWDEKYLISVCMILGELDTHDPGGQWSNRPVESLYTILLPWLPQTLASIEKRKAAVNILCKEFPDTGWKLIQRLLPHISQCSYGSRKPIWMNTIPVVWEKGVSKNEHREQIDYYANLAVSLADNDINKLLILIDRLADLSKSAFDRLLAVFSSDYFVNLPPKERYPIWYQLKKFILRHRRIKDADWALPEEFLLPVETISEKLGKFDPFYHYQNLFSSFVFEYFHDDIQNYDETIAIKRQEAVEEIFNMGGIENIVAFAETVEFPEDVGIALGNLSDSTIQDVLLPHFLNSANVKYALLAHGFVTTNFNRNGLKWYDSIDKTSWSIQQKAIFFCILPFCKETWNRVEKWLGDSQGDYWQKVYAYPNRHESDLLYAVEKLLEYGRIFAAIEIIGGMIKLQQAIDIKICKRALLPNGPIEGTPGTMGGYYILEIIKYLQNDKSISSNDLANIEWVYLSFFDRSEDAKPKTLENKLANDPDFFYEIIELAYHSKEWNDIKKQNARNLLKNWEMIPGTQTDSIFNQENFLEWIKKIKEISANSSFLDISLYTIGEVLIYSPVDPDGFWIHKVIAEVLNEKEHDGMRQGFINATINSRGAYYVDPTGKAEEALAEMYRKKADETENKGFHRLAETLRDLVKLYKNEVEEIGMQFAKHEDSHVKS